MRVAFFPDQQSAIDFEAECYAQALANGQVCDRWSEIISDPVQGFGVVVYDRAILQTKPIGKLLKPSMTLTAADLNVVEWEAPAMAKA